MLTAVTFVTAAVAPFIGTALSPAIFRAPPPPTYVVALILMAVGAFPATKDEPLFKRRKKSPHQN